jgi:hypothetical protein
MRLVRNNLYGTYAGQLPPEPTTLIIARRLFPVLQGRGHLKLDELMAYYKTEKGRKKFAEPELERSSWEKLLNRLHRSGALLKIKGTRSRPTTFRIRKGITEAKWAGLVLLSEGGGRAIAQKVGKSP